MTTEPFRSQDRDNMARASKMLAGNASSVHAIEQSVDAPNKAMFGVFMAPLASKLIDSIMGSNAGILRSLFKAVATVSDVLGETAREYGREENEAVRLIGTVSHALEG